MITLIATIPNITDLSLFFWDTDSTNQLLAKLKKLDMVKSFVNTSQLSKAICTSLSLECLNLSSAYNVSDDLFTNSVITAPLHYLNISNCDELTDLSLNAIARNLSGSLTTLKLCRCVGVSAEGVVETAKCLPGLKLFDVSFLVDFDESHLLTILEMYECKPWQVCVRCAGNGINFQKLYEALMYKSSVKGEVRVKRVRNTDLIGNIFFKNLVIQFNVDTEMNRFY
jgi:hypothetical protein